MPGTALASKNPKVAKTAANLDLYGADLSEMVEVKHGQKHGEEEGEGGQERGSRLGELSCSQRV